MCFARRELLINQLQAELAQLQSQMKRASVRFVEPPPPPPMEALAPPPVSQLLMCFVVCLVSLVLFGAFRFADVLILWVAATPSASARRHAAF
jgi:hypothetical protein